MQWLLNAILLKASELKLHKNSIMHTIKNSRQFIISLCVTLLSVYKRQFYQIVESNRFEKSIRQQCMVKVSGGSGGGAQSPCSHLSSPAIVWAPWLNL